MRRTLDLTQFGVKRLLLKVAWPLAGVCLGCCSTKPVFNTSSAGKCVVRLPADGRLQIVGRSASLSRGARTPGLELGDRVRRSGVGVDANETRWSRGRERGVRSTAGTVSDTPRSGA